ncbi:serine/threonine-protein kinase [Streptacidiphilus albus]|uniref:serine/threonine-protein kinase n=1 Tax=Streptacidiphilus albus TaxID=105425 RepID=UPI00128B0A8E|nr:serine/threonine-protein kinase [Streptacidiphilus albus]
MSDNVHVQRGLTMNGQVGLVVGGRYRLSERIRSEADSTFWTALDQNLGTLVAANEFVPPDPVAAAGWLASAADEARNAAGICHPALAAVQDVFVEDGTLWIIAAAAGGRTLRELISDHGPLPATTVALLARGLLDALGATHGAGLPHRRVVPDCVVFTAVGNVALTSLGVPPPRLDVGIRSATAFDPIQYAAPELLMGNEASSAADLYALGATLFHVLEGQPPYLCDSAAMTVASVLSPAPPPMPVHGYDQLRLLVSRLLTKDPDGRPNAVQARDLLAGSSGGAIPAFPARPSVRAAALVTVLAVAAVASLITVAVFALSGGDGSARPSAISPPSSTGTPSTSSPVTSGSPLAGELADPCSAVTPTVQADLALSQGQAPATKSPAQERNCQWQSPLLDPSDPSGPGTFTLVYFAGAIPINGPSGVTPVSVSVPGLPAVTEVSTTSGLACVLYWHTSFGETVVEAQRPTDSVQLDVCPLAIRFAAALAPSLTG